MEVSSGSFRGVCHRAQGAAPQPPAPWPSAISSLDSPPEAVRSPRAPWHGQQCPGVLWDEGAAGSFLGGRPTSVPRPHAHQGARPGENLVAVTMWPSSPDCVVGLQALPTPCPHAEPPALAARSSLQTGFPMVLTSVCAPVILSRGTGGRWPVVKMPPAGRWPSCTIWILPNKQKPCYLVAQGPEMPPCV